VLGERLAARAYPLDRQWKGMGGAARGVGCEERHQSH